MVAPILRELVDEIGRSESLDELADRISPLARRLSEPTPLKNLLSGVWLGHRLHPLLTDLPIGAWTSAAVLDVIGGSRGRRAADRLVSVGIVSAVPAAAAGLSDWYDTQGRSRRVGTVHALANSVGLVLQVQSRRARRRGHRVRGVLLSWTALGVVALAGYLGGHLAYVEGVGVVHDPDAPHIPDWRDVLAADDLPTGAPRGVEVDGHRVAVVDEGDGRLRALAAVCNHAGGPLDGGRCENGQLVCPWHGSRFRTTDGAVCRGPATEPQPAYDVRLEGGKVQLRSPA